MARRRLWLCEWLAGEILTAGASGRIEVVLRIEGLPFSVDGLPGRREVNATTKVWSRDRT